MQDKNLKITPHPVYIIKLMYPYLSLLIIPVIKGAIGFINGNIQTTPEFLVAEMLLLSSIILVSFIKYRRFKIFVFDEIEVTRGLFCKIYYKIPKNASQLVVIETNPILSRFNIYRLKIYTETGGRRRPGEDIPIRRRDASGLIEALGPENLPKRIGKNTNNVLMALAASSSAAGLLIIAPVIKITAGIFGKNTTSVLPEIQKTSELLENFEKISVWLTSVLLVGYVISFIVIILRNFGFKSSSDSEIIMLDGGVLPNRKIIFKKRFITAVEVLSPPIMRLLNRCIIKFSCAGYGRSAGELSILIPCIKPDMVKSKINRISPRLTKDTPGVYPSRRVFKRCIFMPFAFFCVLQFFCVIVTNRLPKLKMLIFLIVVILSIFDILFLFVRLNSFLKGKFSVNNGIVTVISNKRLSTVEVMTNVYDVDMFKITRTPFDNALNLCKVSVRVLNKSKDKVSLKFLPFDDTKKLIYKKQHYH